VSSLRSSRAENIRLSNTTKADTITSILCSTPGALEHSPREVPTEVESILHKLDYPPALVRIVAVYKITTRDEFLRRLRAEESRLKWQLGKHRTSFEDSGRSPRKEQNPPEKNDMPAVTFIAFMQRSKKLWPHRQRRRRSSVEEIMAQVPHIWGKNAEVIQRELETLLLEDDMVPARAGRAIAHKRNFSDSAALLPSHCVKEKPKPLAIATGDLSSAGNETVIYDSDTNDTAGAPASNLALPGAFNRPPILDLSLRQRFLSFEATSLDRHTLESATASTLHETSKSSHGFSGNRKRLPSGPKIPKELRKATSMPP
jgi:hypothetical protein